MIKARQLVNKAKRLERRLRNLQFDIYNFSSELEDLGLKKSEELASESGFELDESQRKMNDLWRDLENAYCRKLTK